MNENTSRVLRYLEDKRVKPIMLFAGGPTAYGLSDEHSDIDINGIYLPGTKAILGIDNNEEYRYRWDDGIEGTAFDVRKATRLMLDSNPNMLDFLFCDEEHLLYVSHEYAELRVHRDKFIGPRIFNAYRQYAVAQSKRIEAHRAWLKEGPPAEPSRADFGLSEGSVIAPMEQRNALTMLARGTSLKHHDLDELAGAMQAEFHFQMSKHFSGQQLSSMSEQYSRSTTSWLNAMLSIGNHLKPESLVLAKKELAYREAKNQYDAYKKWEVNRNPKRAELEAKVGFDAKHGSHVIRLLRMSYEIITEKKVLVNRKKVGDADELLAIKRGKVSYEDYLKLVHIEQDKLSSIQHQVDFKNDRSWVEEWVKDLLIDTIQEENP